MDRRIWYSSSRKGYSCGFCPSHWKKDIRKLSRFWKARCGDGGKVGGRDGVQEAMDCGSAMSGGIVRLASLVGCPVSDFNKFARTTGSLGGRTRGTDSVSGSTIDRSLMMAVGTACCSSCHRGSESRENPSDTLGSSSGDDRIGAPDFICGEAVRLGTDSPGKRLGRLPREVGFAGGGGAGSSESVSAGESREGRMRARTSSNILE